MITRKKLLWVRNMPYKYMKISPIYWLIFWSFTQGDLNKVFFAILDDVSNFCTGFERKTKRWKKASCSICLHPISPSLHTIGPHLKSCIWDFCPLCFHFHNIQLFQRRILGYYIPFNMYLRTSWIDAKTGKKSLS